MNLQELSPRKGYSKRADIPEDLLEELNNGRDESRTLSEWLAVDASRLLAVTLQELDLSSLFTPLMKSSIEANIGDRQLGSLLGDAALGENRWEDLVSGLMCRHSDRCRSWAGYVIAARNDWSLADRIDRTRHLAKDRSMNVRECAWHSVRPAIVASPFEALRVYEQWVLDPDANIRRCAVEATRPRGVWAKHIASFKADPSPAFALLGAVRSDPSRYVQLAVGNWLNDAWKGTPGLIESLCQSWLTESPTKETAFIVKRGLRNRSK